MMIAQQVVVSRTICKPKETQIIVLFLLSFTPPLLPPSPESNGGFLPGDEYFWTKIQLLIISIWKEGQYLIYYIYE